MRIVGAAMALVGTVIFSAAVHVLWGYGWLTFGALFLILGLLALFQRRFE